MGSVLIELESLFIEAKQRNEFGFVQTLINYQGMGSKEDMNNLYEWFSAIDFYKILFDKLVGNEKTRIGLLLYCTFFESSEFYNILGSLCYNSLGYQGSSYLYWKSKKYDRFLGTGEKISLVTEVLNDCNKLEIISFFEKTHFQAIRNTFFHSSYSLTEVQYLMHDVEPIFINRIGTNSFDVVDFIYPKINDIYEFFNTFRNLYLLNFESYTENKMIKGAFPYPTDITILGSETGLRGFEIKNTTKLFDEWHDSGIYYDTQFGWHARNLVFRGRNIEDIEIDDKLKRYESKSDISKSDSEFLNLMDKVVQRNRIEEMPRIISLLIKFGDDKYQKWENEQNIYKKESLPKYILPFYKKVVEINKHLNLKAVLKKIEILEKYS